MNKLLSAGFFQLRKNKAFLFGMLFMFGLGVFAVVSKYSDIVRYNENEFLDDAIFAYVIFIGCCSAVFCSLFIGTDYSDGTIRNKLIIGHTRRNIYCSNLLISITATFLMAASFLLSYCSLGSFLLKAPQMQIETIVYYFMISLFTMAAFTSLFNMLSMLITKKSTSAVVCLLIFIGLLIVAMMIKAKLDAPEFITFYSMTTNGIGASEMTPNPKYLQATARAIYQFFYDFFPSGQSLQLSSTDVVHPLQMMLYSLCIIMITSVGGILVFSRKDLK